MHNIVAATLMLVLSLAGAARLHPRQELRLQCTGTCTPGDNDSIVSSAVLTRAMSQTPVSFVCIVQSANPLSVFGVVQINADGRAPGR